MVREKGVVSAGLQTSSSANLKPETTRTNPQKEAITVLVGSGPIRDRNATDTLLESGVYQRFSPMEHTKASTRGGNLLDSGSTDFPPPVNKAYSKNSAVDIDETGREHFPAERVPSAEENEEQPGNLIRRPAVRRFISPKVSPYAKAVKNVRADMRTAANEPFTPSSEITVNIASIEMHSVPPAAPVESRATKPQTGPLLTLGEY